MLLPLMRNTQGYFERRILRSIGNYYSSYYSLLTSFDLSDITLSGQFWRATARYMYTRFSAYSRYELRPFRRLKRGHLKSPRGLGRGVGGLRDPAT